MPAATLVRNGHPLTGFVTRLQSHAALKRDDIAAIESLPFVISERPQNSQIVREGDLTRQCTILLSGFAQRHRNTNNGERQILGIYIPGDALDFEHLHLPVADDTIQAIKDCTIATIGHDALRDLTESRPAVAHAITTLMLVDSSIFREWILNVGQRDARARIAHLLCEISARLEAQGYDFSKLALPLTQDHIADATGLTSVYVNRTLKAMQAAGEIKRNKALVMLPDPRALREVAGFDARYLHLPN